MPAKKIWIVSKDEWITTLQSSNPNGDTSWLWLSKSSGDANWPTGELIDVNLSINYGHSVRMAKINVLSNGVTRTVDIIQKVTDDTCEWGAFICDYLNRSGAFNALATSAGDIIQTAAGEDILVTPGYTYNGVAITTGIVIHRTVEGITIPNYPKFYSLLSAFDAQPEITAEAFRKLPTYNKIVRINDFITYINTVEGISVNDIQTNSSYKEEATCV